MSLGGEHIVLVGGFPGGRQRLRDILREQYKATVADIPSKWEAHRSQRDIRDRVRRATVIVFVTTCLAHSTQHLIEAVSGADEVKDRAVYPSGRGHTSIYVDRIPTPPKPALFLANQVHQVLQQYLSVPLAERPTADLEQMLRRNWRRHPERPIVFAEVEEEAEYGRRALSMLQNFRNGEDDQAEPEAVEQWFEVDVGQDVRLNGKVDRVDRTNDGLVLVDYKTGRLWSREAEAAGLQPVTYAFLVQEATGEPISQVVLYFLVVNERIVIRPDPDVLQEFRRRLLACAAEIEAEREYSPLPSSFCSLCDYRDRCPAGQAYVAEVASGRDDAPALPF